MDEQLTLYRNSETGPDYAGDIGETTPVSWRPRGDLRFEEWIAIGNTLQQVAASLNWWVGDWLNYGERRWGEMYAKAETTTGWVYQRLANAKWVASHVEFSLRKENLSWSHHAEVAPFSPAEQTQWLDLALANGWSVRQLRDEINGLPAAPPMPEPPPLPLPEVEPNRQQTLAWDRQADPNEPDGVPFNHVTRWGVPGEERTPLDDYEQQG